MADGVESPADAAGRVALERMFACLDEARSFRLEAGAGAGKTYSLDKALRRLIDHRGSELLRQRQQVGPDALADAGHAAARQRSQHAQGQQARQRRDR